jgi:hypothetical protein
MEVECMNSHVWLNIDVEDSGGSTANWGFDVGGPNGLIPRGWRCRSVTP